MFMRKTLAAAVLMAAVSLLGGCEMLQQEKWEPQESAAISIDEEGIITEIIQEKLDAAYYDATELQTMIDKEVADYNSQHGENQRGQSDSGADQCFFNRAVCQGDFAVAKQGQRNADDHAG